MTLLIFGALLALEHLHRQLNCLGFSASETNCVSAITCERKQEKCEKWSYHVGTLSSNETQDQLPRPRAGVRACKLKVLATQSGETERGAVSCIAWLGRSVQMILRRARLSRIV
jgi:hypothetical protein